MQKPFLLLFVLLLSPAFGGYVVQIAVYQNHFKLMSNIKKIAHDLHRENIIIREKNGLHFVSSDIFGDKKEAKHALKAYQTVFHDAYIIKVKREPATKKPILTQEPEPEQIAKKPLLSKPQLDAKTLLEHQVVYLCMEHSAKGSKNEIIKMAFKQHDVFYSKLKRDTPPLKIPCRFEKNAFIFIMSGFEFRYNLYEKDANFLHAEGFINGKQKHIFRYYFSQEEAQAFVARGRLFAH